MGAEKVEEVGHAANATVCNWSKCAAFVDDHRSPTSIELHPLQQNRINVV